ncbi:hypothetical protein BST81_21660 [Leptolyngbya sp. 'hensonii']|nr:hypothetical protein BST81_21660 [Leptolyngbya sp. 'hensonii']
MLVWAFIVCYRWPILFWGGLWLILALVTWLAISGILSPGLEGAPTLQATTSQSSIQSSEPIFIYQPGLTDLGTSWLVAAIALGCSIGSFIILRRLTHLGRSRKPKRSRNHLSSHYPFVPKQRQAADRSPLQATKPVASKKPAGQQFPSQKRNQGNPQVQAKPKPPAKPQSPRLPQTMSSYSAIATKSSSYVPLRDQMPSAGAKGKGRMKLVSKRTKKPIVTVVPPERSHSLDWGDAGLANRMDIRKRRSYR